MNGRFEGSMLAAALGVAGLLVALLFFGWLATPNDFRARTKHAEAEIATAEATLDKVGGRTSYRPGSVCTEPPNLAASALSGRLGAAAAAAGVTLTSVSVTPGEGAVGASIAPIDVQFVASGRYDAVIAMLEALSRQTPTIFIQSSDLTSKVSTVELKLSGRVFCSVRV